MYAVEGGHLETVKKLVKYDFIKYDNEKKVSPGFLSCEQFLMTMIW